MPKRAFMGKTTALGHAMLTGRVLGLPLLQRIEERQGYQPMRMSKEDVLFANEVFILQRRKPWNEQINQRLQSLFEVGVVDRLTRKYISARYLNGEGRMERQQPKKFSIEHFLLAIYACCLWLAVALAVWGWEMSSIIGR